MSTSGSCLCGAIKYTFTGAPAGVAVCHCMTCQKLTGSAFSTNVIVPTSQFSYVGATPTLKTYSMLHPGGLQLTKAFCTDCGSTVHKSADGGLNGTLLVQGGSIDNADGSSAGRVGHGVSGKGAGVLSPVVQPGVELWVSERAPWVHAVDGAAPFEQFSPGTVPEKAHV